VTIRLSDTELLGRLIGIDSTSARSNRPIADFICDYLDRPGVELIRQEGSDDKLNVVAWLGPRFETNRKGLVLSGHMDCVPAKEKEWRTDPFAMAEDESNFYGRGASDMKGFVALAMNLAASIDTRRLRHPLVLLFTYDEEVGTIGAKHFIDEWPRERALPRNSVIGEPTSLRVVRMHKGHLKLRLVLTGISAHSGYPHLGINAIEAAGSAIAALARLRKSLERERHPYSEFFEEVPFVPLNIGTVHGGAAVNVVPDRCEIELGIRMLPGMDRGEIIERVRHALRQSIGDDFRLDVTGDSPPMLLDENAEIHRVVSALVHQNTTRSVSYATDAGWFQTLGLECALFGPGSIEVAHRPNEYVPKDELRRAVPLLEQLVARFCEVE
jgi:acetylornithine deacetylase